MSFRNPWDSGWRAYLLYSLLALFVGCVIWFFQIVFEIDKLKKTNAKLVDIAIQLNNETRKPEIAQAHSDSITVGQNGFNSVNGTVAIASPLNLSYGNVHWQQMDPVASLRAKQIWLECIDKEFTAISACKSWRTIKDEYMRFVRVDLEGR